MGEAKPYSQKYLIGYTHNFSVMLVADYGFEVFLAAEQLPQSTSDLRPFSVVGRDRAPC
jgi:hypothetical protein